MKRRTLLQLLLTVVATLPARLRLFAQAPPLGAADEARIRALADAVLPDEIGAQGRATAVDGFLRWVREYRTDAETDHGYGFTRLRRTPASPAAKYPTQLDALDLRALGMVTRGRQPARDAVKQRPWFAELSVEERRFVVEGAIADAKIERLPGRPDGGHVATDLMAFYFNSVEANDLCYRAAIGRDTCRGLEGSDQKPSPLGGR